MCYGRMHYKKYDIMKDGLTEIRWLDDHNSPKRTVKKGEVESLGHFERRE